MTNRECEVLEHIRTYCQEIQETVARYGDSFDTFLQDKDYKKSVVFSILQIGELTTHLSDEFKAQHTEIPWREIRGTRNVAAHHYGKLDEKAIFESVHQDIPELERCIGILLDQEALFDASEELQVGETPEMKM